jgi:hypothetical protein
MVRPEAANLLEASQQKGVSRQKGQTSKRKKIQKKRHEPAMLDEKRCISVIDNTLSEHRDSEAVGLASAKNLFGSLKKGSSTVVAIQEGPVRSTHMNSDDLSILSQYSPSKQSGAEKRKQKKNTLLRWVPSTNNYVPSCVPQ